MKIIKPSYTIEKLDHGEEILKSIERCGRTCYKSEDKITPESRRKFVKMILERGHHSVIEHPHERSVVDLAEVWFDEEVTPEETTN